MHLIDRASSAVVGTSSYRSYEEENYEEEDELLRAASAALKGSK
jgi:hypothetical protein